MGHFLCGVENAKDFVVVHLHCIVSSSAVAIPKILGGEFLTLTVFCLRHRLSQV